MKRKDEPLHQSSSSCEREERGKEKKGQLELDFREVVRRRRLGKRDEPSITPSRIPQVIAPPRALFHPSESVEGRCGLGEVG